MIPAVIVFAWLASLVLGVVGAATRDEQVATVFLILGFTLAPLLAGLVWLVDQGSHGDGDIGLGLIQMGLLLTWPISIGAWFLGKRLGRR